MKTREEIQRALNSQITLVKMLEKNLARDYQLLAQGRVIQDQVRQLEISYESALSHEHALRWVLDQPTNEPF